MADDIVLEIDDPAVLALLPRYLSRRADDILTMRDALARSSFEPIAQLGHRIRGSGAAYGMPLVTQIGRQLERAAMAGDVGGVGDRASGVDAEALVVDRIGHELAVVSQVNQNPDLLHRPTVRNDSRWMVEVFQNRHNIRAVVSY